MSYKITFAVVGCGVISRFHIGAINKIDDARLIGVYDCVLRNSEKLAQEYQTRSFASYEELLEQADLDAVCICTPSHLHATLALKAIHAGKHVLIEKPIALTLADCDKISKEANKMKVQVGVVSQLRYSSSVLRVKNAIENGVLGRITRCDLYMKYYRSQSYYDSGDWRGTLEKDGGGALMNQGIHGVDLILYLMGEVTSIYALSDTLVRDIEVEDTLSAVLKWKNGAHGVIQASVGDYPGFARRIEINGEQGVIVLQEDKIIKWEVENEPTYQLYQQKPSADNQTSRDATAIDPSGHIMQICNFIDAIRKEGTLFVDDKEGRKALQLVLSAYKSATEKKVIYL